MMTTGMLAIWSLSHSYNDTRMPFSNKFCWDMGPSMDCQWYVILEGND